MFREPIPEARSIGWLPVGDSRHVIASLQRAANRRLFVSQEVLVKMNAIGAASSTRPVLGLLLGALYECPDTHAEYMIVNSLGERAYSLEHTGQGLSRLKEAMSAQHTRRSHEIVGWYFTAEAPGRLSHEAEAAHRLAFDQPWHVALAVGSHRDAIWGTFFRCDFGGGAGIYAVPFRELVDPKVLRKYATLPTAIAWSSYLTGDPTTALERSAEAVSAARDVNPSAVVPLTPAPPTDTRRRLANVLRHVAGSLTVHDHPSGVTSDPSSPAKAGAEPAPAAERAIPFAPVARADTALPDDARLREPFPARASPDQPHVEPQRVDHPHADHPSVDHPPVEPPRMQDPRVDEPRARPRRVKGERVTDTRDTSARGAAERYIEMARQDGFFPIASFAATAGGPEPETLWLLHDPYCGLLLVVNTVGSTILDASLHYNLHVDDAAILKGTFSEHRDLEAQIVYRRESCAQELRARCRELRNSQGLVHDWKVTPPMYFVTPGEWESLTGDDPLGGARAIQSLNRHRVGTLPETIVLRYGLAAR